MMQLAVTWLLIWTLPPLLEQLGLVIPRSPGPTQRARQQERIAAAGPRLPNNSIIQLRRVGETFFRIRSNQILTERGAQPTSTDSEECNVTVAANEDEETLTQPEILTPSSGVTSRGDVHNGRVLADGVEQSIVPGDNCTLCVSAFAGAVFLPCGHGGVCLHCAMTVYVRNGGCPTCRRVLTGVAKIENETDGGQSISARVIGF